jgi:hypothetical protein
VVVEEPFVYMDLNSRIRLVKDDTGREGLSA